MGGILDLRKLDLHALRHREGMGKPAFPPQGVGTPVLFCKTDHQTWQAFSGIMGWPVLQPKAWPNSGIFCTTPFTRN